MSQNIDCDLSEEQKGGIILADAILLLRNCFGYAGSNAPKIVITLDGAAFGFLLESQRGMLTPTEDGGVSGFGMNFRCAEDG